MIPSVRTLLLVLLLVGLVVPVLADTTTITRSIDTVLSRTVAGGENFSAINIGTGTGNGYVAYPYIQLDTGTGETPNYTYLSKLVLGFNFTSIPVGSTISEVKIGIRGYWEQTTAGNPEISLVGVNGTTAADYNTSGTTLLANNLSTLTYGTYYNFTLNENGLNYINLSEQYNYFAIVMNWSVDNNAPYTPNATTYERLIDYTERAYITYIPVAVNPPVANFTATPLTGTVPLSVSFTDTSEEYPTSWNWSFGDGEYSESQNPVHIYETAGTYTVSLNATNTLGSDAEEKTDYITPTPKPPAAAFTATPLYGAPPLTVAFTDTSDYIPTSWLWDFGDGSSENNTQQNPVHTFTTDGYYDISLTATNAWGSNETEKPNYIHAGAVTRGDHPYLLFRDINDVPGFKNRNKTPWAGWETVIKNGVTSSTNPQFAAMYYHICSATGGTGCTNYVNTTVSRLTTNWYAGDISAVSYDLIAGVNKTDGSTTFNETTDALIRDRLAAKANYYYTTSLSWSTANFADNGFRYKYFAWILGECLYDYDTTGKGLNSTPDEWIHLGTYDMFIEDTHYAIRSDDYGYFWWGQDYYGGASYMGSYQYVKYMGSTYLYPLIYSNIYGNIFELYPEYEQYWKSIIYYRLPNGYSPNFITLGNVKLDYWSVGEEWLDNESRANLRWSDNKIRTNYNDPTILPYANTQNWYSDDGYGGEYGLGMMRYLTIDDYTAEPMYAPVDKNYITPHYSTLRTSWAETCDFISFISREITGNGRADMQSDQFSFEYYSHGDLTMPNLGETKHVQRVVPPLAPYMGNNLVVLNDPRNNWTYQMYTYGLSTAGYPVMYWGYGNEWWGAKGNAEWIKSPIDRSISSSAIGYVEAGAVTTTRTGTYAGIRYGPLWGDTIYWNRSVISPGNEYMVVTDRLNSTLPWEYRNVFRLGSFNITPSTSSSNKGAVLGDLYIDGALYNWSALTYRGEEVHIGDSETIEWRTINPYGEAVSTKIFSSPSPNLSIFKYITRIGGYDTAAEVTLPQLFTNYEGTSLYRVTALLSSWQNGTDARTPTELDVTGTGSAIKVVNVDSSKVDRIYTGLGTSTFDTNYQTDADTAVIREWANGTIYSFTLTNGTFLNKSSSPVFDSNIRLDYVSTITKENGTRFNVSGTGSATMVFYDVTEPTTVKRDGLAHAGYSYSGGDLTIMTTLSDHVIEFTNGNEVDYPDAPEYEYEEPGDPTVGTETFYITDTARDIALRRQGVDENFTTIVGGEGVAAFDNTTHSIIGLVGTATPDQYATNVRNGYCINTASIPNTADISSAWFSVYGSGKGAEVGSLSATLTGFTPDSQTAIVASDYNKFDSSIYSTNVSYDSWSTSGYNAFYFTNLSAINKEGYTCFVIRSTKDADNTDTGLTWASGGASYLVGYDYSSGDSSKQPKLDVIYDVPETSAPVALIYASPPSGEVPLNVFFSDNSTGNATSWLWTFDGVNTSGSQDTEWTYDVPGTYNVSLYVENDAGNDTAYQEIEVTGITPSPLFSANITTGVAPLSVLFTDESTGATSWYYEFGDGNTSTDQNPEQTYTFAGTFDVNMKATNEYGSNWYNLSSYITVSEGESLAPRSHFNMTVVV